MNSTSKSSLNNAYIIPYQYICLAYQNSLVCLYNLRLMPLYIYIYPGHYDSMKQSTMQLLSIVSENIPLLCIWQRKTGTCLNSRYTKEMVDYQDFLNRELLLTRKLLNQGFLLIKSKSSIRKFYDRQHDLVNRYGYLCHKWPWICSTCRKHLPVLFPFMTCERVFT
jgi:hypothetical protein